MLLTEQRPLNESIDFKGRIFFIDMSFNNILTVFEILEDEELTNAQKLVDSLYMLTSEDEFDLSYLSDMDDLGYASELQEYIFNRLLKLDDNEEEYLVDILGNKFKPPKKEEEDQEDKRSYDFVHDAHFIYSSFLKDYQIDLYEQHNKMHWEVFIALFEGLSDDTKIKKVINIRTRDLPTGKGSAKEREELIRLKNIYKLPERRIS